MKRKNNNAVYASVALLTVLGLFIADNYYKQLEAPKNEMLETTSLVPLDQIVSGGPPKDGIPAIDSPKFVAAESGVDSATLGILVKVGDDARFYPYNVLLWHEIVNDVVGGKPLAVTFCPLCATGIVFEREISGEVYDFGTSGKLYNSNLVMYDRQTDTYWSQAEGRAIAGRLAGTKLAVYPSSVLEFGTARQNHPGLKVLSTDTGYARDYSFNPYSGYEKSDEIYFPLNNRDTRLPSKTLVYGIVLDGRAKAYVYEKLLNTTSLLDTFSGRELSIGLTEDKEIVVVESATGERVLGAVSYWFSWAAHNPETDVWA